MRKRSSEENNVSSSVKQMRTCKVCCLLCICDFIFCCRLTQVHRLKRKGQTLGQTMKQQQERAQMGIILRLGGQIMCQNQKDLNNLSSRTEKVISGQNSLLVASWSAFSAHRSWSKWRGISMGSTKLRFEIKQHWNTFVKWLRKSGRERRCVWLWKLNAVKCQLDLLLIFYQAN